MMNFPTECEAPYRAMPDLDADLALRGLTYCAYDIETTGLSPRKDRIIEIGAVVFRLFGDGLLIDDRFEMRGNPGCPIDPGASAVNGITDEMVAHLAPVDTVYRSWVAFQERNRHAVFLAHNGKGFDGAFLAEQSRRSACSQIVAGEFDTLLVARRLHKGPAGLDAWMARYSLGVRGHHAAADDAYRLALVWRGMLNEFGDRLQTWRDLHAMGAVV